jgi:glutamyl-tRNA synthetase
LQKRLTKFDEFVSKGDYFFTGALTYADLSFLPKNKDKSECVKVIRELADLFDELYEWQAVIISELMATHKDKIGWKPKDYFMLVRHIVTGRKDSPPLDETIEVLGRDIVRFRLRDFATLLEMQ